MNPQDPLVRATSRMHLIKLNSAPVWSFGWLLSAILIA